jgi:hypothetical protein
MAFGAVRMSESSQNQGESIQALHPQEGFLMDP